MNSTVGEVMVFLCYYYGNGKDFTIDNYSFKGNCPKCGAFIEFEHRNQKTYSYYQKLTVGSTSLKAQEYAQENKSVRHPVYLIHQEEFKQVASFLQSTFGYYRASKAVYHYRNSLADRRQHFVLRYEVIKEHCPSRKTLPFSEALPSNNFSMISIEVEKLALYWASIDLVDSTIDQFNEETGKMTIRSTNQREIDKLQKLKNDYSYYCIEETSKVAQEKIEEMIKYSLEWRDIVKLSTKVILILDFKQMERSMNLINWGKYSKVNHRIPTYFCLRYKLNLHPMFILCESNVFNHVLTAVEGIVEQSRGQTTEKKRSQLTSKKQSRIKMIFKISKELYDSISEKYGRVTEIEKELDIQIIQFTDAILLKQEIDEILNIAQPIQPCSDVKSTDLERNPHYRRYFIKTSIQKTKGLQLKQALTHLQEELFANSCLAKQQEFFDSSSKKDTMLFKFQLETNVRSQQMEIEVNAESQQSFQLKSADMNAEDQTSQVLPQQLQRHQFPSLPIFTNNASKIITDVKYYKVQIEYVNNKRMRIIGKKSLLQRFLKQLLDNYGSSPSMLPIPWNNDPTYRFEEIEEIGKVTELDLWEYQIRKVQQVVNINSYRAWIRRLFDIIPQSDIVEFRDLFLVNNGKVLGYLNKQQEQSIHVFNQKRLYLKKKLTREDVQTKEVLVCRVISYEEAFISQHLYQPGNVMVVSDFTLVMPILIVNFG